MRELEAVRVRALAKLLLLGEGGTDVVQLSLDLGIVRAERRETAERVGSRVVPALLDEPPGRLGEVEHAAGEDEGPDELDRDGDPPCGVVGAVLGRVVDDGGEEETDGDGPLVPGNDGTTNPLGRALGLVHGDEGRDETDTGTGEDTADDERREIAGTGLEGNTKAEDQAGDDDTDATTEDIGDGRTEESTWVDGRMGECRAPGACSNTLTEEGTGRQDGDHERLAGRGKVEAERVGLEVVSGDTEGAKPVSHLDDTRDGTGVVTEKDTTKGSKGSHSNTGHPALGAGDTDAPACSNWTARHSG